MAPSPKITPELGDELVRLYQHPQNPRTQAELVQICAERGIKVSQRTLCTLLNERGISKLNKNVDCPGGSNYDCVLIFSAMYG